MYDIRLSGRIARKSPRRRSALLRRIYLSLFLIIVAFVSFTIALRNPYLFVRDIQVEGVVAITEDEVVREADEVLSGSFWYVLPKRNILLSPSEEIKTHLLIEFPKLKSAHVVRKDFFDLSITVAEREERYRFCEKEAVLSPGGDCFSIDETGTVFSTASSSDYGKKTLFREIASTTKSSVLIPSQILSEADMRIVTLLEEGLERLGFLIHSVSLGEMTDATFWLMGEGGEKTLQKIEVDYGKDPYRTLSSFEAALSAEPLKSKLAKNRNDLLYIDIRFGNKVFYRFR